MNKQIFYDLHQIANELSQSHAREAQEVHTIFMRLAARTAQTSSYDRWLTNAPDRSEPDEISDARITAYNAARKFVSTVSNAIQTAGPDDEERVFRSPDMHRWYDALMRDLSPLPMGWEAPVAESILETTQDNVYFGSKTERPLQAVNRAIDEEIASLASSYH